MPESRGLRRPPVLGPRLTAAAALAAVIAVALAWAQESAIPSSAARERRDRLVGALRALLKPGERGVFLLAGEPGSDMNEFRQRADFLYLTGFEEPGAQMVLVFEAATLLERLYLVPSTPDMARWSGETLAPGRRSPEGAGPDPVRVRAAERTGFRGDGRTEGSGIGEIGDLAADLRAFLSGGAALFIPPPSAGPGGPPSPEERRAAEARAAGLDVRVVSAAGPLAALRLSKSSEEIALIRRAVAVTCEAHRAAMRTIAPGLREYEVEAAIEYVFTRSGARWAAYPTIVGSGPNSCVLHYSRNDRTIGAGDLVIVDAGAEYRHYASDVTRTLPASGRFTPDQARIYRAVLHAQDEGAALVKPGVRPREICDRVAKILDQEGLGSGIQHTCSHFVGLEVHDAGGPDTVLAPGMVLSVEPGVYYPDRGIGVRIEDLFLVTEGGGEKLSSCIPSSPEGIEAEMAGRGEAPPLSPGASASPRR